MLPVYLEPGTPGYFFHTGRGTGTTKSHAPLHCHHPAGPHHMMAFGESWQVSPCPRTPVASLTLSYDPPPWLTNLAANPETKL
jgi:hypothetical protein